MEFKMRKLPNIQAATKQNASIFVRISQHKNFTILCAVFFFHLVSK